VLTDLGGVNKSLACKSIKEFPNSRAWDKCFANQTFGYYDFFALRANKYLNKNCFLMLNELELTQGLKI